MKLVWIIMSALLASCARPESGTLQRPDGNLVTEAAASTHEHASDSDVEVSTNITSRASKGPFLDDDVLASHQRFTWIERYGRSAVTLDEFVESNPVFDDEDGDELPVVRETSDAVRVVHDLFGVRYGLYIKKVDLGVRLADRVALRHAPGNAGEPMAVELSGGAEFVIRERRDGWMRIEYDNEDLTVRGWVPLVSMASVFTVADNDWSTLEDDVEIVHDTKVFDKPGGQVIAELRTQGDGVRSIQRQGPKEGGFVEIEVVGPRVRVRGFVPLEDTIDKRPSGGGFGFGVGGNWGSSHASWLDAPVETLIHETPDGPIFAMTIRERSVIQLTRERSGEWLRVRFRTAWRMVSGWVECPAVRRMKDPNQHYRCTTADDPRSLIDYPVPNQ